MKILAVVLILIAAAAGFYCGMVVTKKYFKEPVKINTVPVQNGASFTAEVESIGSNTLTVKLPDGTSKTIEIPTSTPIRSSKTINLSDIKTGQTVLVTGLPGGESSVVAKSIQLFESGLPKPAPAPGVPSSDN